MYDVQRRLLKSVDRRLPAIKMVSLRQWIDIYRDLSTARDIMHRDTFALTGNFTCPTDGQRYRAKIDTSSSRMTHDQGIDQICDIDSVIGIMYRDIPLKPQTTLRYFMLASPTHTLTSNLHIPDLTLEDQYGSEEQVALHRIPNARFAEIGERGLIRIFVPDARQEFKQQSQPNCIPARHMALLYDRAILPAAIDTLPLEIRRTWPGSYQDEKWRSEWDNSKGNQEAPTGNYAQQTGREVHSEYMPAWLEAIRTRVEADPDLAWARGFFFALEMRGVKNQNISLHPALDEPLVNQGKLNGDLIDPFNPRTMAVERLLSDFNTADFQAGCWFLDLATTVHPEMISYLTGVDLAQAERWVRTKGGCYRRDEVAHLGDMAGYAIVIPGPGIDGVHFIQVYSTDKSVTYRVDGPKKAKRTSPFRIVTDWKALPAVAVRIESRISFEHYPLHHHFIPLDTIRPWFLWLSNSTFWSWKVYRLRSIQSTVNQWISARHLFTLDDLPEAGSLLILLSWMANALVNRPDDGSHWDEVRDAGSVHIVRGHQAVPDRPLTAYFLHSLTITANALPRISSLRTISIATITYLFGDSGATRNELEVFGLITQPTLPAPEKRPKDPWVVRDAPEVPTVTSHSNKQREVRIENAQQVPDQFAEIIPEPDRAVRYDSEDEDQEQREQPTRRSAHLTWIIYNYPIQVIAKAPNLKNENTSWCSLLEDARLEIKFDFFCDLQNLAEAFPSRVMFGCHSGKWDKTVEVFFPSPEGISKRYQGFHTLSVRKAWFRLLATFPQDRRKEIVTATRAYVNRHWRWLPLMAKDHLWSTGLATPKYASHKGTPGGPWIILNPRRVDPQPE
ncbi:hypothetical protein RSAG8_11419, partial [Rhizoctonia solani AG-8 WAC10335]